MKQIRKIAAAFFAVMIAFLSGCSYDLSEFFRRPNDVNDRSASLADITADFQAAVPTLLPQYTVLVVSDVHFGVDKAAPETELFAWIDSFGTGGSSLPLTDKPQFALALGDLVEHGKESEYAEFSAFADKIRAKGIPVYSVCGNHDLYNSGWTHWQKTVEPHTSYYRFQTNAFSWYFLDSGSGTHGKPQLDNFAANVKRDPKNKLVFTHYPLYAGGIFYFSLSNPQERAFLLDLFARNKVRFTANGHWHPGGEHDFGAFKELNVSAFRDTRSWYLLRVDETAGTVTWEKFSR